MLSEQGVKMRTIEDTDGILGTVFEVGRQDTAAIGGRTCRRVSLTAGSASIGFSGKRR